MSSVVAVSTHAQLTAIVPVKVKAKINKLVNTIAHFRSFCPVVGLCGRSGSGKTTAIGCIDFIFGDKITTHEISLADPLKDACSIMFGFNKEQCYGKDKETLIREINKTPREILQEFGTLARKIDPDVFASAAVNRIKTVVSGPSPTMAILGDIRYPNEIKKMKQLEETVIIKLYRTEQTNMSHLSEASVELCETDVRIVNETGNIRKYMVDLVSAILHESEEAAALIDLLDEHIPEHITFF